MFCNSSFLTNIGESPDGKILKVYTNGGESTQVGTLEGFGEVWFNPEALANILLMAAIRQRFRVTIKTIVELNCLLVINHALQRNPLVPLVSIIAM